MTQTPPPQPLWAPGLRRHLNRFFTRMDRRKALQLTRQGHNMAVYQWRLNYDLWWVEHGWQQGAPTADQVLANRQP